MRTVRAVLDDLTAGRISLDDAVADFKQRSWAPRPKPTAAQLWGVADENDAGLNDISTLESDSRLTSAQYQALAHAALD